MKPKYYICIELMEEEEEEGFEDDVMRRRIIECKNYQDAEKKFNKLYPGSNPVNL